MTDPDFSNYVIAGSDTLVQLMGKFIESTQGRYLTSEMFSDFMLKTVNKFLFSFGVGVDYKNKVLTDKQPQKFLRVIKFILEGEFMKNIELYWDSGGFQVAQGAFKPEDIPRFTDMYYNTIIENPDMCKYAFIQDLPPGPGSCDLFSSYKQIEDLNRESYLKCRSMIPEAMRKEKLIYIHHFRTPHIFDIWHKFLFDEDLADGYEHFGTGGLVANLSTDIAVPIILYSIPLSSIILYAKNKNMKKIKFHVLGGANFADVFYHKLFSYHIKQYHDIEVDITYDSSMLFKGLAVGRYLHIETSYDCLVKMDIRSSNIQKRFDGDTVENHLYRVMNETAEKYNFKLLTKDINPIYDLERGTWSRSVHMYLVCYTMDLYRVMEKRAEEVVKKIYPLYQNNEITFFNKECYEVIRRINQGKETRKQRAKSNSLFNSLKLLEELDIDKCRWYVANYLSKDGIEKIEREVENPKFEF